MNPEIKAQWVAALRSGAYEQGQKRLRPDENTFCVLGVLCDLHRRSGRAAGSWEQSRGGWLYNAGWSCMVRYSLPAEVSLWAEVRINPRVMIDEHDDSLGAPNDNGIAFGRLADAIEKQL